MSSFIYCVFDHDTWGYRTRMKKNHRWNEFGMFTQVFFKPTIIIDIQRNHREMIPREGHHNKQDICLKSCQEKPRNLNHIFNLATSVFRRTSFKTTPWSLWGESSCGFSSQRASIKELWYMRCCKSTQPLNKQKVSGDLGCPNPQMKQLSAPKYPSLT